MQAVMLPIASTAPMSNNADRPYKNEANATSPSCISPYVTQINKNNIQHRNWDETMNVLHICETASGGISTYLLLLDEIVGTENHYYVPSCDVHHMSTLEGRVSTFHAQKRSAYSIFNMLKSIPSLVRKAHPDIIFFHSTFSLIALALIKLRFPNIKTIYCGHGWGFSRYFDSKTMAKIVKAIEKHACLLPDVVTNISTFDYELARRNNYYGRHVLIENSVRPSEAPPKPDHAAGEKSDINILFVGRHDRQKGLDILLESFDRAKKIRHDLNLLVIGSAVRDDGFQMTGSPGVKFAGWVEQADIDNHYREADILAVPSRWEGFGLVVPEAYRNGTPVISSNNGALPSLVQEGVTGYVVPLEIDHWTEALISLDKSSLRKMRNNCLLCYKTRFSPEIFKRRVKELYGDLANESS